MRLLFIRHGDPDYEHDTLTEKGRREAQLLSDRMVKETVRAFYVSPLGRARDTAAYTLDRLGRDAQVMDWLEEFPAKVDVNLSENMQKAYPNTRRDETGFKKRIAWDMVPSYWKNKPEYYDREAWHHSEITLYSDINEVYDRTCRGLDELLAQYGYIREGYLYHTEMGNNDTICFFCHFGVTCVLLSYLWGVSPFTIWHSTAMAPTSVTEIYTEEREKGIVSFRASKIGDISHLYAANEPPSFSARFCEKYENDERH